jgi:WhiB family transcriptional regulator, redox-sensing transcriptional regulator
MRDLRTAPRSARGPRDWRDDAACRDTDPDLFFPEGTAGPARDQADQAKQVCQACPVRTPSLRFALWHGLGFGVWGGATGEERRFIQRPVA